MFELIT